MSTSSSNSITMKPSTVTVSGPGASGPYQGAANQTASANANTAALTKAGNGGGNTKTGGGRRRRKTRRRTTRQTGYRRRRAKKTYRRRR